MNQPLVPRPKEVRTAEDHVCPDSVPGICALIRRILESPGKVESFAFEVGQPVRVVRWVERNDLMDEEEESLDALIQGMPMTEYLPRPGASSFEICWCLIQRLRNERLYPVCWATGLEDEGMLDQWFGLQPSPNGVSSLRDVLALPVQRLKSIPEETLLLCGASTPRASTQDIVFSIKTTIDLWSLRHAKQDDGDADQVGDHPQERHPPARALEGARGRNRLEGGHREGHPGRLGPGPVVHQPAQIPAGEGRKGDPGDGARQPRVQGGDVAGVGNAQRNRTP